RAAGMRHQSRSVRHDIYREIAPIACHLQGDPPKLDSKVSTTPESQPRRTVQRPRPPGPQLLNARSGLVQRAAVNQFGFLRDQLKTVSQRETHPPGPRVSLSHSADGD